MAMLTRGISFRRQGSSGMSWADNWTFTDAGMFRAPKAPDLVEPEKAAAPAADAEVPTTSSQKLSADNTNVAVVEISRIVPHSEPLRVQETTSSDKPHRRGMWGIRWIKSRFKKSRVICSINMEVEWNTLLLSLDKLLNQHNIRVHCSEQAEDRPRGLDVVGWSIGRSLARRCALVLGRYQFGRLELLVLVPVSENQTQTGSDF
ncbi:hypothetical protein CY35_14G103900 [Sphagnum magellanicum]|nr:hypothetical protein CY35_14G103900 [Sphagnum magellanicum]